MRILVLDDIARRHEFYRQLHSEDTVVSCLHYREFMVALHAEKWDLVYLDHDLGDFVNDADTFVDGWGATREFNGCHAAMRICEMDEDRRPSRVVIQSCNGSGSADMCRMLERIGMDVTRQPYAEPDWSDQQEY